MAAKGQPKTGGRRKGTPNQLNADVKAMILGALHDAGGQQYLTQQARENPTAFLTLLGKVLPTTINANARITMDPSEMTDAEILAELAAARVADGTAEEEGGPPKPSQLH
jgi:hypothetical protein